MTNFNDDLILEIVSKVTENHKKTAVWLPFNALDILSVFDENELTLLNEFLVEMRKSTEKNNQTAVLKTQAAKYAKVVIKLLSLAKVIP